MIQGSMSMGVAGIVSLASMLVVFAVLLLLYVILVIFGKVATRKGKASASPAAPSAAPVAAPKQDDSELIAVLSAAVAEYERTRDNPFVRNRQDLD
ncbi:OadG family transporter subunit [Oscillibacter sp.]|uniref:OadG family transporter subunit n=1 Tax=Oscillibacter sp. TaxID=1945593 RepID=UPI00339141EC